MKTVTVLSSPERRRRWTASEKLRLVADSAASGQSGGEFASRRRAGLPTLFLAWGGRLESCRLRRMARLASPRLRSRPWTAPQSRRGTAMTAVRSSRWCCATAGFSGCRTACRRDARRCWPTHWKAARDDPDAGGDADLGRLRDHRYEERIRWLGHAGAGRAEEGRAFGAPVRVPRQASGSHQDFVVGRHGPVPFRDALRARSRGLRADARGGCDRGI